jgi:hypothetical protein
MFGGARSVESRAEQMRGEERRGRGRGRENREGADEQRTRCDQSAGDVQGMNPSVEMKVERGRKGLSCCCEVWKCLILHRSAILNVNYNPTRCSNRIQFQTLQWNLAKGTLQQRSRREGRSAAV